MTPTDTDPVTVLTGMYAAEAEYFAAGGPGVAAAADEPSAAFDLLAPFFAPDVVLHQAAFLPYGGTWRGHAGLEQFFRAMAQTWASFDFLEQQFLATGPTSVVHTRVHARLRATGRELTFPILQTITIANGRLTEIHPFYWDTAAIAEAAQLPHTP